MKKLSILIIFISLFLTACVNSDNSNESLLDEIKKRDYINVGIKTDSKPFGFIKNNKIEGYDADIARYIAEKLFLDEPDKHIQFIPLKASEKISALNTDKADIVIATFSINESRKSLIDFTIPYYVAGQTLMVKTGSNISTVEQLNNKAVAVVLGTTAERTVRMLAPNATSIGSRTYEEAFEYLKKGDVQAILADDTLLYGLLENNKNYRIVPARYTKEYYAIGLKQGDKNRTLKKFLDNTILEMQETNVLNGLKRKWLPRI